MASCSSRLSICLSVSQSAPHNIVHQQPKSVLGELHPLQPEVFVASELEQKSSQPAFICQVTCGYVVEHWWRRWVLAEQ